MDSQDNEVATNLPFIIACSILAIWIAILLLIYRIGYYNSPPIVAILAALLFNEMLSLVCQLPSLVSEVPNWLCLASIVGTTFFRLGSCLVYFRQTTG